MVSLWDLGVSKEQQKSQPPSEQHWSELPTAPSPPSPLCLAIANSISQGSNISQRILPVLLLHLASQGRKCLVSVSRNTETL